MKRLKLFVISVMIVTLLIIPNVTLAYDDYCPYTEDGIHDFTETTSSSGRHPHAGWCECVCGERVYLENMYNDHCEKCKEELCQQGIHCYVDNIYYIDGSNYSGYGECNCGKRKYFTWEDISTIDEPYPGIMNVFDQLFEIRHPHRVYPYDNSSSTRISMGDCGVCRLKSEYSEMCQNYTIESFIYGYEYSEYYEYDEYEPDYVPEYVPGYIPEDTADYDEYEEYNEYDENSYPTDDFYDWLEMVKEILSDN